MRVTQIEAHVRYSADTGRGAWKTIELAAQASIDSAENWEGALSCLYDSLVAQFRDKWQNGPAQPATNGHPADPETTPPHENPAMATTEANQHFCQVHQTLFRRRNGRDGGAWWSHKVPDGWCREARD
ncbi:MAG TPA: hypothetical protein VFA32_07775 [Dehalococcoidia bacterium]|jgi:hypothetical protein|nr:hypothetical protein [Dehalococcoidia bacterium]